METPGNPAPVSGSDEFFGIALERHGPGPEDTSPPGDSPTYGQEQVDFWAWDYFRNDYYRTTADLEHASPICLIYVETGQVVAPSAIAQLAITFEDEIYHELRGLYGPEPEPGIDGRRPITLLLLDVRDPLFHDTSPHTYISGYFDPTNQYRQADLDRELPGRMSNEREMLYLDVNPTEPEGEILWQTAAHEFAHLIQWNHDSEEDGWLTEGLSQLAVHLCGLGHPREHVVAFLADPDVSLTSWDGTVRDYGKVYLFMLYLHEQVGEERVAWLHRLVSSPLQGIASLSEAMPLERELPEVYRDFALAVLEDEDPAVASRYGFRSLEIDGSTSPPGFPLCARNTWEDFPVDGAAVEVGPWTLRGDVFRRARGGMEIELTPSLATCVGAAWRPVSNDDVNPTHFRVACPQADEPVLWDFGSAVADVGGTRVTTAIGNARATTITLVVSAIPPARIESPSRVVFLPVATR